MSALAMMYRAVSGDTVACSPVFDKAGYVADDSYPSPANAGVELEADGTITRFTSTTNNILIGRWDGGCGTLDRADYDFRFDRTGGLSTDLDGTLKQGIWHPGTSLIAFSLFFNGFGVDTIFGNMRIRPAGGGSDIDTATLNIVLDLT